MTIPGDISGEHVRWTDGIRVPRRRFADSTEDDRRPTAKLGDHRAPRTLCSGTERVQIARVGRASRNYATFGSDRLPNVAVYEIQKLIVDNTNLDREWYDELVAVVVHALSIGEFHRGLGLELLPEPIQGEPSRHRPAAAEQRGTWPAIVPRSGLPDGDAELYDPREWDANVISALSLIPEQVRWLHDLSESHYCPSGKWACPIRCGRCRDRRWN